MNNLLERHNYMPFNLVTEQGEGQRKTKKYLKTIEYIVFFLGFNFQESSDSYFLLEWVEFYKINLFIKQKIKNIITTLGYWSLLWLISISAWES